MKLNDRRDDILLFLSLLMIISGLLYFIYVLNWSIIAVSLILTVLVGYRLRKSWRGQAKPATEEIKATRHDLWLGAAYLILYVLAMWWLWQARSDRALITPWAVVPAYFFWLYAFSSLCLILMLRRASLSASIKLCLLSAHYFLSFAVALVVYKIGYGYDPFIHEAAMKLIAETGAILPKTPYYLGQYGLLVTLHKISWLDLTVLNKLLVPLLSAIFLPAALYDFLRNKVKDDKAAWLTVLFALGLTFSPLILTTPQNLSYLFLLLTVLAGSQDTRPTKVWILALATAVIHPLTGLPALVFAALGSLREQQERLTKKTIAKIRYVIFLFAALALPLTLFFLAGRDNSLGGWKNLLASLSFNLNTQSSSGREDWLSNAIYFFANNYTLLIIILVVSSAISYWKNRRQEESVSPHIDDTITIILPALFLAYCLSGQINFGGLIDYEQADYAGRLPVIMMIFCLPLLLRAGQSLLAAIEKKERAVKIIFLIFGLGLLNVSLYISYPRFDRYWNSRGYSTGRNDLEAVVSVENQAQGRPYIALANQQVSAGALQIFGFHRYYADSIYFYPIPTGGPLYRYYLDMVYKEPQQKTMADAMALAEVKLSYLLVNKYWYQSDRVIAAAKLTADKWWTINNEVYIFQYSDK